MTKTHTPSLLHCTAISFILVGLSLFVATIGEETLQAQLSGNGTLMVHQTADRMPPVVAPISLFHAAASSGNETTNMLVLLGGLFILVGCGMHALYVLRNERPASTSVKERIQKRLDQHIAGHSKAL